MRAKVFKLTYRSHICFKAGLGLRKSELLCNRDRRQRKSPSTPNVYRQVEISFKKSNNLTKSLQRIRTLLNRVVNDLSFSPPQSHNLLLAWQLPKCIKKETDPSGICQH